MKLSRRLVAGATAVALGMGVMLVGGASPAGAVETQSTQWIWCDPTPLGTQKQKIPTTIDAPAAVEPGETFDMKVSTTLPSIVLNNFIVYNSDTLWQMPDQVTLNSVTFEGGTSGDPAWNGAPPYPNPNSTAESQWASTSWIEPSTEQILEINPWFLGAPAEDNPYSPPTPIPAAVPEDWEADGNTVLVQSIPDPGLFMGPEGQLGFRGRPVPQSVIFNVTVKEDAQLDQWIDWAPSVTSHSYANGVGLETNTSCNPQYCAFDVGPGPCSHEPPVGPASATQQKMTARYILGKTAIGNPAQDFNDVPRYTTFYPEIFWMANEGISEGYPGNLYKPTDPLARQAMSAFLYRLENGDGEPPQCETAPFIDVAVDHPFCPEISWMADEGISEGYETPGGMEYRPNQALTRQAMSAFLYRLAEGDTPPPSCTPQVFTDVPPGSAFCGEIKWMANEGISTGFQPGPQYRPNQILTRQAMSAFLYRYAELV